MPGRSFGMTRWRNQFITKGFTFSCTLASFPLFGAYLLQIMAGIVVSLACALTRSHTFIRSSFHLKPVRFFLISRTYIVPVSVVG